MKCSERLQNVCAVIQAVCAVLVLGLRLWELAL